MISAFCSSQNSFYSAGTCELVHWIGCRFHLKRYRCRCEIIYPLCASAVLVDPDEMQNLFRETNNFMFTSARNRILLVAMHRSQQLLLMSWFQACDFSLYLVLGTPVVPSETPFSGYRHAVCIVQHASCIILQIMMKNATTWPLVRLFLSVFFKKESRTRAYFHRNKSWARHSQNLASDTRLHSFYWVTSTCKDWCVTAANQKAV